jgi:hypothetical protein
MLGRERYMALNGTDAQASQDLSPVPEAKTGRCAKRPVLWWLDLFVAGVSRVARAKGNKPWRTCRRARPGNQTENRFIGRMTRKALTAKAEPCCPARRMPVLGALCPETYRRSSIPGTGRIGRRRRLTAFAPT